MSKQEIIIIGAGEDIESNALKMLKDTFTPVFVGSSLEARNAAIEIAKRSSASPIILGKGELALPPTPPQLTIADLAKDQSDYLIKEIEGLNNDIETHYSTSTHNYVKESESFKKNKAKRKQLKKHKKKLKKRK